MLKRFAFWLCVVVCIGIIIPAFVVEQWGKYAKEELPAFAASDGYDERTAITVLHTQTGEIERMPLSDYLIGVVAAEMPASFEEEALKAQAVAARSYTLYKIQTQQGNPDAIPEHNGADICDDPGHCKAYSSVAEMKESYGGDYEAYYKKLKEAVNGTDGEIMTYEDQPILAVFHSTSGPKTEDAKNVWGSDVPYLKSVDSPGQEESPRYNSDLVVTADEMKAKILELQPKTILGEDPALWMTVLERSEAGTVLWVQCGDQAFTGVQVRNLFDLRSANFNLSYQDGKFLFTVVGYGHGVGMSQYGAEYMAKEGKSYEEILTWYYTGAQLLKQ